MDNSFVEDEAHVLYYCDLYADARNKLVNSLKQLPSDTDAGKSITSNINLNTLDQSLMKLLSPHASDNGDSKSLVIVSDIFTKQHLSPKQNDPHCTSQLELRSYVINAVCTYISRCFEKRWKFVEDTKSSNVKFKSIVVMLRRQS